MLIFGIILTVFGLIMTKKPYEVWEFGESWKYSWSSEPSDAYITYIKIEGIILIVIGVALIISRII